MNRFHIHAMNTSVAALVSVFAVLMLALPARAVLVSFQDGVSPTGGYTGAEDTSLFSVDPNSNYGADPRDHLGQGGDVRSILMRFDVSALSGLYSRINSVTLNLSTLQAYGSDT